MRIASLQKRKLVTLIAFLMATILILSGCGGGPEEVPEEESVSEAPAEETTAEEELPTFTMEEIEAFDGQDGNPAYVVVDGLVYDVTESGMWSGGVHQGQFQAGQDLTEEIMEESPHGTGVLNRMEIVGQIAE